MVTKDEMEKRVNEKLDTDIEWSKINKEDLKEIDSMVEDGTLLEKSMRYTVAEHGKGRVEEIVKEWKPGDILMRVL